MAETTISHVPDETAKTVGDTGDALVDPIVKHEGRLTQVENNVTQAEERLNRQIIETESQLRTAIQERAAQETITTLEARIVALEAKLEEKISHPVETVETPGTQIKGAVEFVTPPIEESPTPPERERKSIRHKRKNRRKVS
jgi:hypothetical protein